MRPSGSSARHDRTRAVNADPDLNPSLLALAPPRPRLDSNLARPACAPARRNSPSHRPVVSTTTAPTSTSTTPVTSVRSVCATTT